MNQIHETWYSHLLSFSEHKLHSWIQLYFSHQNGIPPCPCQGVLSSPRSFLGYEGKQISPFCESWVLEMVSPSGNMKSTIIKTTKQIQQYWIKRCYWENFKKGKQQKKFQLVFLLINHRSHFIWSVTAHLKLIFSDSAQWNRNQPKVSPNWEMHNITKQWCMCTYKFSSSTCVYLLFQQTSCMQNLKFLQQKQRKHQKKVKQNEKNIFSTNDKQHQ